MSLSPSNGRLIGLAISCGFPAVFWPVFLKSVGSALGHNLDTMNLVLVGLSIGLFLLAVCARIIGGETDYSFTP
jgi:hypothetical protein